MMPVSPSSYKVADQLNSIDLTDLDLFTHGDPLEVWSILRQEDPIFWNESSSGDGFWALTRYADVHHAYLEKGVFSSASGTILGGSYQKEKDSASGKMLICSDQPEHPKLRKNARCAFNASIMESAARNIESNLDSAFERLLTDGGGDFAHDIARELPAGFLTAMFGVSRSDAETLLLLTEKMIGIQDESFSCANTEIALAATQLEILDMMDDLLSRTRRYRDSSEETLISILADSGMTDEEILYNGLNVAVGGNETTPYTACAEIVALSDWPDQADDLYRNPDISGSAVEEILRWSSTNAYVQRTATQDIEMEGKLISKGDSVTLWNASANRDELVFDNPNKLDFRRSPNPHLAFGVGPHRCIGAKVAQMEIKLFTDYLVRNQIRLAPTSGASRLRSNFMLGYTSLPVEVVTTSNDN